jgi:hypothetical protein
MGVLNFMISCEDNRGIEDYQEFFHSNKFKSEFKTTAA